MTAGRALPARMYYFQDMPRTIDENKPLFTIGAVAEILSIKPRVLRSYEDKGLIKPSRTEGNRRLYSLKDIDVLAYIQYLTTVKRVNIAGVLEIQELLTKLDEKTRNAFMEEVGEEIKRLPTKEKQAYAGEDDELSEVVIRETVEFSENKTKSNASGRKGEPKGAE
ncbi:MAG: MerR family transcriptional regulator [Chitinivibrionales bacterium]|nr:MerR family transcriptional regulator [Chitinivibrionales bacterium]MBD3396933.1 MerR family transcriptional regulator [Chitinivibrionales bacterium]